MIIKTTRFKKEPTEAMLKVEARKLAAQFNGKSLSHLQKLSVKIGYVDTTIPEQFASDEFEDEDGDDMDFPTADGLYCKFYDIIYNQRGIGSLMSVKLKSGGWAVGCQSDVATRKVIDNHKLT